MNYKIILLIFSLLILNSCSGFFKKTDARDTPTTGPERARKNLEEGKGVTIKSATNAIRGGGGTFEFNSANPLWRASIEVLDFLPLSNVDYSGGLITTDWYSDSESDRSIKISIRFLTNEISSNSLKIIIHERICSNNSNNNCSTKLITSKIEEELKRAILSKAAELEKNKKK